MKITKHMLKRIIKEELANVLLEAGPWQATIPELIQKAHSIWGQPASRQTEAYAHDLASEYIAQIDRGSLLGPAGATQVAATVTEAIPKLIAVKLCEKYGTDQECYRRYGDTS